MYYLGNDVVDSIELKCFVVSRGAKVDKQVYQKYGKNTRLNPNPLMCNCMILSDETIVQLTDMSFHLKQLGSMLSWNNIPVGNAVYHFVERRTGGFDVQWRICRLYFFCPTLRFLQEKNVIRDAVYRKCGSTRT